MHVFLSALMIGISTVSLLQAEETAKERVETVADSAARTTKKVGNKIKQAACMGTKAECEAKKLKDDAYEKGEEAVDKAKEEIKKID